MPAVRTLVRAVAGLMGLASAELVEFDHATVRIRTAAGVEPFTVELALTPQQQQQGLMFRRSLAPDAGMLFIYDRERDVTMWMKNTLLPLDMVFIGDDGVVTRVAARAVPESLAIIDSGDPARGVLELNAGTADRLGIKPGDRVLYPAFGTAPPAD